MPYVPDPLLFSISVNAQDWIALGKRLVKEETREQNFKLEGDQCTIHCEHEPQNSRPLPLPSGYLCFTSPSGATSGIKRRNSSPRAPLPFFSKTVTMCLRSGTLSQMRPLSTTTGWTTITNPYQSRITLVATFFHSVQLLKQSTKMHGDYVCLAQLHFSYFSAWQLDFIFYLATASHPEKPPSPVLEE